MSHGAIKAASVSGDFFGGAGVDRLADVLVGCRLEHGSLLERLRSAGMDRAILGISAEDIAVLLSA